MHHILAPIIQILMVFNLTLMVMVTTVFYLLNGTITIAPLSTEWSHVVLVAETNENDEEKTTVYFNGDSVRVYQLCR